MLRHRPASLAFLMGFELFGLFALLLYIPFIVAYERQVIAYYFIFLRRPVEVFVGGLSVIGIVLTF